ncbi:MAG: SpoIIE family protein phosphatase [Candidatus Adiutrix sp.]|jgi:sigma-B regulation protein RsbU (phosphoserine phosphatase)|nr:SpoIIE family protein phosphatase [Candidatus Adiutrix sp.]
MAERAFTLRQRLLALLALSVGLAILPFSLYTARGLGRDYLEAAWTDIRRTSDKIKANLDNQYLIFLTREITNVISQKEVLRKLGTFVSHNWEELETMSVPQRDLMIDNQVRRLGRFGLMVGSVKAGRDLAQPLGFFKSLGDLAGLKDLAGRPLAGLVTNPALAGTGEFAVFKTVPPGQDSPCFFLMYLVPNLRRDNIVIILMRLDETGSQGRDLAFIAAGLQENLNEGGELRPGLAVALLDSAGHILARHGEPLPAYPWADLKPEVAGPGQLETVLETAEARTIARLTYFKPLDLCLVLAIPESAVNDPARAIVRRIIWLGVLVMALVLAAGFYFSGRLTGPLNLLTARTSELAQADFSRPETVGGLMDGLPLTRGDEVGRLARAFASLGQALRRKIEELMTATAAKERLEGELGAARDIQMGILPPPDLLPPASGFQVQGFLQSAKEVGGDFYDFFLAPDGRLAVVIGDVSDKGVPAALFMTMTVTLVRQALENRLSPAAALNQINARLCVNNPESMFVTLFIGLLEADCGRLEYANGGHCQPLLAGGREGFRRLEGLSGPVVGAWPGLDYLGFQAVLDAGEICLLYTDGVTEAQNEAKEFFSQDRLEELVQSLSDPTPAELNRRVYEATLAFRGQAQPSDDLTLLAFRACGASSD